MNCDSMFPGTWQYHVMSGALSLQLAQVQEIVDLSATQSFSSSSA